MGDGQADVTFRIAVREDLPAVVALLAHDDLGSEREPGPDELDRYAAAFADIDADPRHELIVGDEGGHVVAVLQLTILPCLTHGGRRRAQIEGVRVAGDRRGSGIGHRLLEHAFERARAQGAEMVQLTTDKRRPDALRMYESAGFVASHEGLKRSLVD
jgi:ribosomal protein S18 acetylase RimI-like enzyme